MSPSAMKQMSCESGLSATASPRGGRLGPHLGPWSIAPSGNIARASWSRVSTASTYDWSLAASTERRSTPSLEPGVVPGDDRVEAERQRPVQHRGELDLLVAAQARVRRAAGGVLGDEVVDDVGVEPLGQVPDVERDAEHVGGPARVAGVLERAAAAGAGARGLPGCGTAPGARRSRRARRRPPERAATASRPRRDHRGEHPHRALRPHSLADLTARAAGAPRPLDRAGRARRAARRRRPRPSVCPRENRSEPRARSASAPIASSTWLGWATPAEQAEPVEHSMPRASSSMSSASPSQPGKDEVRVAGQPVDRVAVDSTASGTARQHAGDQLVPQRRHPGGASPAGPRPRSRSPPRGRRSPATSSVPERTSRSWPPPCSSGVQSTSRREQQRAGADRAAELVPGHGQRVAPAGRGEVDRQPARPPAPRRCGAAPRARRRPRRARRSAARCRPRCWPTSRVTSATVRPPSPSASAQRVRVRPGRAGRPAAR